MKALPPMSPSRPAFVSPRALRSLLALGALPLALWGCGSSTTTSADAGVLVDRPVPMDTPAVEAAVDAPSVEAAADVPVDAGRDAPPDDVDPTCALGAVESCLAMPPGPCPDLSDGVERTVQLGSFVHSLSLSCAGRMTSIGPDAFLPLRVRETSDVVVSAVADTGDTAVIALYPAARCGEAAAELECNNASSAIGGIATFRAPSVPPGDYVVAIATATGTATRVFANLRPARPRALGDLCPGVTLVPDGPAVSLDTRSFAQTADYGTTCGYYSQQGLGWTDAVFSFTTTATRDVTVNVAGTGEAALQVDVSPVCGSRSQSLLGCAAGLPARRTLRSLPAGTYYVVVDYRPEVRPDHVLTVQVSTAAPSPPPPTATCPGLALESTTQRAASLDELTPLTPLSCLTAQRVGARFSVTAPTTPADLVFNVQSSQQGSNAAMELRAVCDDPDSAVGGCAGPRDRTARSVWHRVQGLTPGARYTLQTGTNGNTGTLSARWYPVPPATPEAVGTAGFTCGTVRDIPPTGGVFTGTIVGATAIANPGCATGRSGCQGATGAVYRLVLTEMRRVVATLRGSEHDPLLELRQGDACPGMPIQGACNDDALGTDSQVEATLGAGTYWVYAAGCGADQRGPYTLDVAVLPP